MKKRVRREHSLGRKFHIPEDNRTLDDMQSAHDSELLIDGLTTPPCFIGIVKEGYSLPWEAKGLDSLELPSQSRFAGLSGYREQFRC